MEILSQWLTNDFKYSDIKYIFYEITTWKFNIYSIPVYVIIPLYVCVCFTQDKKLKKRATKPS